MTSARRAVNSEFENFSVLILRSPPTSNDCVIPLDVMCRYFVAKIFVPQENQGNNFRRTKVTAWIPLILHGCLSRRLLVAHSRRRFFAGNLIASSTPMLGQPTFALPEPLLRYAAEFGITRESVEQIVAELHRKPLHNDASINPISVEEFCRSLRLEELVLARACAAGNDRAWDVFLTRYREKLYGFARQIAKEDAAARELADGIYAELYGIS